MLYSVGFCGNYGRKYDIQYCNGKNGTRNNWSVWTKVLVETGPRYTVSPPIMFSIVNVPSTEPVTVDAVSVDAVSVDADFCQS